MKETVKIKLVWGNEHTANAPQAVSKVKVFGLVTSYAGYLLGCLCGPVKMDFRSSVSKSGLPGEGRHEGLVPRNAVLTNGFI